MQTIGSSLLGFVIVLGFLIFVHEAGHFLVAKLFRVRVLVFSFGFGKRLAGFRRGDTDYRVSLIPLGGYVRMAGDTPEENQPSNPDEFLSKPKWQRFLILFAGPFMNLLIAVAFVAGINMVGYQEYYSPNVLGWIDAGKPAEQAGLRIGDRITKVGSEEIREFEDLRMIISMNAGTPLRVVYERNGQRNETTLTPAKKERDNVTIGQAGFGPVIPPVIFEVAPNSAAARAGLQKGDRLVAVNDVPIRNNYLEFQKVLEDTKKPVALEIARGGQRMHTVLPAPPDPKSKESDLYPGMAPPYDKREHKLSLVPAVGESISENLRLLRLSMSAIRRLFRPEGSVKELSGPIAIAKASGETLSHGMMSLVAFMALVSLQLGIMNLLPIPVLDGGHIMILLIEGAARRDLSLRVKERIQQLGFAALATLMIVVIYNDVVTNVIRNFR